MGTDELVEHYGPLLQEYLQQGTDEQGQAIVRSVFELSNEVEDLNDPGVRSLLEDGLRVIAHYCELEGPSDQAALTRGKLLSMLGRHTQAVTVSEREAERRPTVMTATAAAMAQRRAGNLEAALPWLRRGADLDPNNEACLLDMGDLCIELQDFERALSAYEEALTRVDKHAWAHPSAVYCRYRISGDPEQLEELRYMANAGPCTCGLGSMLGQIFGGYSYEDQRLRAEGLMRELEPDFVPQHRPHEHEDEESDDDEEED